MGKQELKPRPRKEDKPEEGKVYALTGGPGSRCIANGNSWSESEVKDTSSRSCSSEGEA